MIKWDNLKDSFVITRKYGLPLDYTCNYFQETTL